LANIGFRSKNIIDIVKYRYVWLGIFLLVIIPAIGIMIYSTLTTPSHSPLRLGIDFTGGSFLQYGFEKDLEVKDIPKIREVLAHFDQAGAIIQIQEPTEILGNLQKTNETSEMEAVNDTTNEMTSESSNTATNQPASDLVSKTLATNEVLPSDDKTTDKAAPTNQQAEEITGSQAEPSIEQTETAVNVTTDSALNESVTEETTTSEKVPAPPEVENLEKDVTAVKKVDESIQTIVSIRVKDLSEQQLQKLNKELKEKFGNFKVLQVTTIGPALGKELLRNAMLALLLVFGGIVVYLTFRFQLDYAVCAFITLLHDALFVMGVFALFGILFKTEVDSLFVTAILTVIGFSVHDSIVVFDRIRENARFLSKKKTFNEITNDSVNQTLARSINTSLTTIFVLLTLYFFGGVTTKDFVLAMTLGIGVGTYSSIFVASVLLSFWRDINAPKKRKGRVAA
jgi:preprotein translocase subunit SecF